MVKNKKYHLFHKKIKKIKVSFNSELINGYVVKPRNQKNYDGIVVNKMTVVDLDFIRIILNKKIKKKLDVYLQFLISVLDEDDTDPGHLMFALNDLDRYKHLIMNNYRVYLEKKYVNILMDKIALIEQELRSKIKCDVKNLFNEQMELHFDEPKNHKSR